MTAETARTVEELKRTLARAAETFVALDDVFGEARARDVAPRSPSGMPGADVLLALVARGTRMPAPVEAREAARALLAAISAVDALEDALQDAAESVPKR